MANKKQFIAIITINEEDTLRDSFLTNSGDEEMQPEEVVLIEAINQECNWVRESGISVEAIREATEEEIKKLLQ